MLAFFRILAVLTVFIHVLALPAQEANASSALRVRNDPGGHVVDYMLRVKEFTRQGRQVQVIGRCDSACTLFLSLPASQICVESGARFGFHLPFGGNREGNRVAKNFMLASYPGWVREWITSKGGLSSRLIVMDYEYARLFVDVCKT
ncbi:hypothetical protein [Nitratireductor indicus]|uniref:Signal peptide protein n=1 Tax=Nitratireductor indicus C115 TaxID=1231190 RepID=K2PGH9_9HYPH|nr:hypothetical protein [Nitratireductor indicus]EKF40152.1 signal peptide protein [Nitratireductor indicus C115]MDS1138141.1 hypothetical protein [Nitratireductor indicus]SFQ80336.1 hypothetical protein SAMN05216176_117103 [Nitratireductor indicus]